jgi:hypothetical protein
MLMWHNLVSFTAIAWRCSTASVLVPFYKRYLLHSTSHLDVGPGSGYFTSHTSILPHLDKLKHLALLDSNPTPLHVTAERTVSAGYKGPTIELYENSVLKPLPKSMHGTFDSISLFYVLHCLPGSFPTKASHVAATLLPTLTPGPDSVIYGSTLLGTGVARNIIARLMTWHFNRTGIFSNYQDDVEGLKAGLSPYFDEVEVEVVGSTALFVCRGPKSQHVS